MLAWLRSHGVHTGPTLYTDSLRLSVDTLERLQPRGEGEDPLAEAYPLGRDVVAPIEWRTEQPAGPDVVGNLRQRLLDEARRRRT